MWLAHTRTDVRTRAHGHILRIGSASHTHYLCTSATKDARTVPLYDSMMMIADDCRGDDEDDDDGERRVAMMASDGDDDDDDDDDE